MSIVLWTFAQAMANAAGAQVAPDYKEYVTNFLSLANYLVSIGLTSERLDPAGITRLWTAAVALHPSGNRTH